MTRLEIRMSLADWKFIDAGLDNCVATNREVWTDESDPQKAARAHRIRERGWDVTRPIEQPILDAGTWPPDEATMRASVALSLAADDWWFVLELLRDSAALAVSTGQPRASHDRLIA